MPTFPLEMIELVKAKVQLGDFKNLPPPPATFRMMFTRPPKPSVTEELDDYVLVRRDPKTREIRGVTITNFSQYFTAKKEMKVEIPEP